MDPAIYQQRWHKLRESKADSEALKQLSRQVAFSFIDKYFQSGKYVPAYIDLLCEMATFFAKTDLNNIASSALFGIIVEKLCDDFEDLPVQVYSRVMCQVVTCCRRVPAGKGLDRQLAHFGISSFEQLYKRAVATHTHPYRYKKNRSPRLIVLLSRVTLGADVAILSVMIQRLKHLFPEADMLIVGNRKLHGLFGGNPELRLRELSYARRGGLFERFSSWHATLDILREETADLNDDDVLLIDPDSRISQLGVLPVTDRDNYLFVNTRDHVLSTSGKCVAEWTNEWMDAVFGEADFCYPTVWVPGSTMKAAQAKVAALRAAGASRVIAVNFGVGQNPRKRVGLEFEKRLLRTLVAIPGTVVILDRGFGADEVYRSAMLAADMKTCGFPCAEVPFAKADFPSISHGLVAVECSIGEMAALIAHSDEYIGYDSACQHIAAAARTPTLTVFAGSNNKNFVRRWSACGETDCRIVHVNTLTDPEHVRLNEIISRIMQERAERTPKSPSRYKEVRLSRKPEATEEKSAT